MVKLSYIFIAGVNKISNFIEIKNARIHNLKSIDVRIPKIKLTVITGVSGSGKSSLIQIPWFPN
ncbi:hypothetical protein [Ruminiclostridium josui]|uniref:hypothetical protein n=1 Tax=Ruminiclostridium josui TaxID=1499 RepID=UPI000467B3D0|nr:hypothetical protein [Ruminiclostridium josui]